MNGFKASMESIGAVHLPIKLDEIFDAKTFSSAMSLIEVIPESIWTKATSFLNLSYFDTLDNKVSEMADLFDPKKLASDAKSAQSDALKAAEIVVAMGKSYTSWLKIAKQTFKIKINAKLLDYLKAKVTGGGDFGAADADVDGDSGAGLTLGVDVFSISGTVIGLALLVLALVMAVVHLLIDIY